MKQLDVAIERKQANIQRLRAELTQEEADLKSMLRTRELVTGGNATPAPSARLSIPDNIENILRVAGALHVDQILERLHELGFETVNKQTVTSALTRYHNRGKRFIRTGKNKYAVRENDKQNEDEHEQENE
ncbi:MAG: hypothetical protein ACR2LC_10225 [Pyrinomonadaceae bacterium]